jgi:HAD superfamily hydrolase (TIGR01509 family)
MNKQTIKAIAFDLGGVLIKEKIYPLSPQEQILEKQFGHINPDQKYYAWASEQLNLSRDRIEQMVRDIVFNIYELKNPSVIPSISSDYPFIKLAIASNHLSVIRTWLEKKGLLTFFHTVTISGSIGVKKPAPEFYEILVHNLGEKANDILYIDDHIENIEAAREYGLPTLHFAGPKELLPFIKKRM